MYVAFYLLPKDIRLVSELGWYRLFVGCELTRRVSRWENVARYLSPTGEREQGVGRWNCLPFQLGTTEC